MPPLTYFFYLQFLRMTVSNTISISDYIRTTATRLVPLVQQILFALPKNRRLSQVIIGVGIVQTLFSSTQCFVDYCLSFRRLLEVVFLLLYFFWRLYFSASDYHYHGLFQLFLIQRCFIEKNSQCRWTYLVFRKVQVVFFN